MPGGMYKPLLRLTAYQNLVLTIESTSKLSDQVRAVARLHHLSLHTEDTYCNWLRRFILFQRNHQRSKMESKEICQFLLSRPRASTSPALRFAS